MTGRHGASRMLAAAWLCLCLALPEALRGDPLADDRFIHLGPRKGLDVRVLDIVQDRQGFLWFSTVSGLRRYDGSQIRAYRHDPEDPTSLSDDHTRELWVDGRGTLWISTANGRLDRWLPEEERFQRSNVDLGGIPADVLEITPGRLLIPLTGADVVQVSLADETSARVDSMDSVECVVADPPRDAIWAVGTRGLTRHAVSDLVEQERLPWPPSFAEMDYGLIQDCTLARDGSLWAVIYTLGAIRCDLDEGRFSVYRHDPDVGGTLSGDDLTTVFEDSRGVLWVAGFDGLNRWRPETATFERFDSNPLDRRSLVNHQIHVLYEDGTGQLWLGTDFGAARLDRLREEFQFYSHAPPRSRFRLEGSIRSFAEDPRGRLWVGSRSHGIARLDRATGETLHLSATPSGGGLPDNTVWALSYETPNRLWIGSESGLSRLDLDSATWQTYPSVVAENFSPRIITLFRDRLGSLWAGSHYGLYRHDRTTDTFERIPLGATFKIEAMTDDAAGRLYIGTEEAGLLILDAREGRLLESSTDNGPAVDPRLQSQLTALLTVPGPPETIWAATRKASGVYRLEPDGRWRHFGREQGLPAESVRTLQAAADGSLWMSTGLETLRFDARTGSIQTFGSADGLPSLVHDKASFRTRRGEILFGGLDGFVAFDPESIRVDATPPRIVLTDFRIGDRSMRPRSRQPDSPLATSITLADSVTLNHRQNDFTIELAALHFGDPERNRFVYRLDDVDTDWIEVSAERSFARYAGIPAGRHVFRAKAANRDGIWSEDEARLEIRVLPPPWRSGWAWAVYSIAAIGLVAWWIRTRIVRLELEKELQEKELKILRGLLPICASCKKIRDDEGDWEPLESYLDSHSEAQLSHGICPQCAATFYEDMASVGSRTHV